METIVALTIFSFVVVTIALIYLNGYKAYAQNSERVDVQENLRISLNQMARNLRGASADRVEVKDKDGKTVKKGEAGTQISYPDPENKNYLITYKFDHIDKEVEFNGGKPGENFHPISSHITDLKFCFDEDERIITITIQGEKKKGKPKPELIELTTRVYLRAYQGCQ